MSTHIAMAKTKIDVPDELLKEFDIAISRRKALDEVSDEVDRSSVVRMVMHEFVAETDERWDQLGVHSHFAE